MLVGRNAVSSAAIKLAALFVILPFGVSTSPTTVPRPTIIAGVFIVEEAAGNIPPRQRGARGAIVYGCAQGD